MNDNAAQQKITGRCHCGAIAYEAEGPIVKCSYCDCRACQKATGTLKAPFVTVLHSNFKLTGDKPAEFKAPDGEGCDDCSKGGVWYFCPRCGTQMFWRVSNGKEVDIFAGTLDDVSFFKP